MFLFSVTPQGKLCILDYGLMTEVDVDKRFALLDYVSHLLAKDYAATLEDLVVLGFIPRIIQDDPSKRNIVAPLLANILEQLSAGGGANSVNLDQVGKEIDILSEQYPIIIPSYFGLVLRAFGALEGLGLSVDSKYSIVNECFPYLARRLLSDDSPRIRSALRTFLYGSKGRLDVKRIDDLAAGYRTFTVTAAEAASGKVFQELQYASPKSTSLAVRSTASESATVEDIRETDPTLSAAIKILFSEQGNYVQELLLEEAVRIADALSRSISATALRAAQEIASRPLSFLPGNTDSLSNTGKEGNERLPLRLLNPLYPLTVAAKNLERVLSLSPDDVEALRTLKRLLQILAGVDYSSELSQSNESGSRSSGLLDIDDIVLVRQALQRLTALNAGPRTTNEIRSQVRTVLPLLREIGPGARSLAGKFGRKLAGRTLARLAERVSGDRVSQ